jgi:hypothetical protein
MTAPGRPSAVALCKQPSAEVADGLAVKHLGALGLAFNVPDPVEARG